VPHSPPPAPQVDQPQQADLFAPAGTMHPSRLDENWSIFADAPLRTCFPTSTAALTSPGSAPDAMAFSAWYWSHGWQFAVTEAPTATSSFTFSLSSMTSLPDFFLPPGCNRATRRD